MLKRGVEVIYPSYYLYKLLSVSVGIKVHALGSEREELHSLMSAVIKLNLSGSANAQALALDSGSKDTVNRTLLKTESLSDISGSIHFYNRADIGIVVVRTKEEDGREYTKIKIQKMRFANLGAVGETYFKYGVGVGRFHPYDPVGDHTEWDERDLLTPNTTQEAMQFQAAAPAPSEANVSGFLEQAARQERDMHRPTGLETDDDLPFDSNDETPF